LPFFVALSPVAVKPEITENALSLFRDSFLPPLPRLIFLLPAPAFGGLMSAA
jgi:hypothetical protein